MRTKCLTLSERPQAFRLFCQGASGAHCRNQRHARTMSARDCLSFTARQRCARNSPFALTHHCNRSSCGLKRNVSAFSDETIKETPISTTFSKKCIKQKLIIAAP